MNVFDLGLYRVRVYVVVLIEDFTGIFLDDELKGLESNFLVW